MGTCYSTHAARKSSLTTGGMPGPHPSSEHSSLLSHPPHLHKPYGGRYGFAVLGNSNQLANDNQPRAPLASLDETILPAASPNKKANMNRFGFNKTKHDNKKSGSLDSVNQQQQNQQQTVGSVSSGRSRVPGSTESLRRSKHGLAFNPKESEKFRMIDDNSVTSSSTNLSRKSSQTQGSRQSLHSKKSTTSSTKEENGSRVSEDIINANIPKATSRQVADIDGRIHIPDKKSSSRLPSFPRFRGPFSRSTQGSSQESNKSSKSSTPPPHTPRTDQARNKHNAANDRATSAPSSSTRFLRKGFFSSSSRQKSVPPPQNKSSSHKLSSSASADDATSIPPTPSEVKKSKTSQALTSPVAEESAPPTPTQPTPPPPQPTPQPKTPLPNLGNPVLQQKLVEKSAKLPEGSAPIAMIESMESTGSLDDLTVLDTDVHLDDDDLDTPLEQHDLTSIPARSRSRSGSRSRSRDSLDGRGRVTSISSVQSNELIPSVASSREKKHPLLRRHTDGSVKKRAGSGTGKSLEQEPIDELASLLSQSQNQR
jgi:hypothetical protein